MEEERFILPDFHPFKQTDRSDCWLTCAEMALNYRGIAVHREGFRNYWGGKIRNSTQNDDREGGRISHNAQNSVLGIAQIITLNYSLDEGDKKYMPNMKSEEVFNEIKKYLKEHKPIPIGVSNEYTGHALLIIGYEKNNEGIITYITANPWTGLQETLREEVGEIIFY